MYWWHAPNILLFSHSEKPAVGCSSWDDEKSAFRFGPNRHPEWSVPFTFECASDYCFFSSAGQFSSTFRLWLASP